VKCKIYTQIVVEGGAAIGLGAGMQLLLFGYKGSVNPGILVQVAFECLASSYCASFESTMIDAFAIVGGVNVGPSVQLGATAYLGAFV
jgi:hypothetical protein